MGPYSEQGPPPRGPQISFRASGYDSFILCGRSWRYVGGRLFDSRRRSVSGGVRSRYGRYGRGSYSTQPAN